MRKLSNGLLEIVLVLVDFLTHVYMAAGEWFTKLTRPVMRKLFSR